MDSLYLFVTITTNKDIRPEDVLKCLRTEFYSSNISVNDHGFDMKQKAPDGVKQ